MKRILVCIGFVFLLFGSPRNPLRLDNELHARAVNLTGYRVIGLSGYRVF